MPTVTFFAYGSNLLSSRISARMKSYEKIGIGKVAGYDLSFIKRSKDLSGKATLIYTGDENNVCYGILFTISSADVSILDKIEGYKYGYDKEEVSIENNGSIIDAITYIASKDALDDSLVPYQWYMNYVLFGAIENELPYSYIFNLRRIETKRDVNSTRRMKNFNILIS